MAELLAVESDGAAEHLFGSYVHHVPTGEAVPIQGLVTVVVTVVVEIMVRLMTAVTVTVSASEVRVLVVVEEGEPVDGNP